MTRKNPLGIPGIYTVTNSVSQTVYVGQARNIRKRWEVHRSTLENGNHRNGYLQRAWKKYGAEAFRFEVLIDLNGVSARDLARRLNEEEIAALLRFPKTYNLMVAGFSGTVASEATRKRLSKKQLALWGDLFVRERRVAAQRKRAADPEHQKRRGAAIAAYRNTPEAKAAVSVHMLDLWSDPEHRQAQSEKRKANWQDEAYRAQQSESRKAAWQDPQKRANRVAGLKAAWVRRKARTAEP